MIRNFEEFSAETGHAGISLLYQAIYYAWSVVENVEFGAKISSEKCYNAAPDSEEFVSLLTSSAIDAANACGILIDFVNGSLNSVRDISKLSIDSVDMIIQNKTGVEIGDIESYIEHHPEMIHEFNEQLYVLNLIENLDLRDPKSVVGVCLEIFK